MSFRVAIDAGGTFTDGVAMDETGVAKIAKSHTTPKDPTIGTMECLRKLAALCDMPLRDFLGRTQTIVHGTTLATNVVATRTGPKLGLITTKGFKDRMMFPQVGKSDWKEAKVDMWDFRLDAPTPLTRRHLMTEVAERLDHRGNVLIPLNEDDVREKVGYLKKQKVTSIAVNFLFSHLDPRHERRVAEIIGKEYPEAHVTLSSSVLPVNGEVDRWSTTMFSAYVAPAVTAYVSRIDATLKKEGLKGALVFIQSNGGLATPEIVCENPATILLSGPAAGPALGLVLGEMHGARDVLSIDMGGTSFDVGVATNGVVNVVQEKIIDAKKFCLPTVDVDAIGAGGGSIAWIDSAGRLQVGPHSAGAVPGPACYGKGGELPTVTDADLVLGYIDPDYFLGGETKLRKDLAEKAVKEKIGDPLKLSVVEAAAAIYAVINASMAGATDVTFIKRGYDPRDFALCAAGGAAPVHAARIMEELGTRLLIVPKVAPIYCAYGMLFCDLKHNYSRSYRSETIKADLGRINALYGEMEKVAVATLLREGGKKKDILIEKSMDMRYYGQIREKVAAVPAGPVTKDSLAKTSTRFHEKHHKTIGYSDPKYPTQIIRLHLSGTAKVDKPKFKKIPRGGKDPSQALKGTRRAYFAESKGFVATKVYDGDKLLAGNVLPGPSIVEEKLTTLVILPKMKVHVDPYGNYVSSIQEG